MSLAISSAAAAPSPTRSGVNLLIILLTGAEHLSTKQWKRLQVMLDSCDPTKQIGAAWGVKERLRLLLGEREPSKIRWRLADFFYATPRSTPQCRRPPDSHRPSRLGGQPSSSRSPKA